MPPGAAGGPGRGRGARPPRRENEWGRGNHGAPARPPLPPLPTHVDRVLVHLLVVPHGRAGRRGLGDQGGGGRGASLGGGRAHAGGLGVDGRGAPGGEAPPRGRHLEEEWEGGGTARGHTRAVEACARFAPPVAAPPLPNAAHAPAPRAWRAGRYVCGGARRIGAASGAVVAGGRPRAGAAGGVHGRDSAHHESEAPTRRAPRLPRPGRAAPHSPRRFNPPPRPARRRRPPAVLVDGRDRRPRPRGRAAPPVERRPARLRARRRLWRPLHRRPPGGPRLAARVAPPGDARRPERPVCV